MKKAGIFLLGFLTVLVGCERALEENPKDFIAPSNFYKTQSDAEAAIAGVYSTNTGTEGDIYDTYFHFDLLHADYTISKGSWTSIGNIDQVLDPTQAAKPTGIWANFYNRINRANVVLERVPEIENMSEDVRIRILAEARFIRAMYYLNLVRDFGPIPLRSSSMADLSAIGAPRASLDEIYGLIVDDLEIAENDLPETVGSQTRRASKWAAKLLLAQAYLDRELWDRAAAKADEIINSGEYELIQVEKQEDFYKVFAVETSTEDIMSLHFSPTASTSFIHTFHGSGTPYNKGTVFGFYNVPNMNSFLATWNDADLRKHFNLYSSYIDESGNEVSILNTAEPVRFKKFIKNENGIALYSIPLLRYAEAFLIYAEAACMAEGGPSDLALERLNIIKRRAYGYDLGTPSPADFPSGMAMNEFRDAVIQERAYEFILEPRRWWDLRRTGKAKEILTQAKGKPLIDERLLYPLPQTEIDNNPSLTPDDQNPGY